MTQRRSKYISLVETGVIAVHMRLHVALCWGNIAQYCDRQKPEASMNHRQQAPMFLNIFHEKLSMHIEKLIYIISPKQDISNLTRSPSARGFYIICTGLF